MKVLQVTPRYPPQTGGVETHVREVSERLVERGHEVTVVTADAGAGGGRREERAGVRVRRYRSFAPGGAIHACPQITAAVRRSDADVVHAHNYHSLPAFFAALGVGERRFVVTPHYHGGSADAVRQRLLAAYRLPGGWALRRADEVTAVSEWERSTLAADFGVDASVVPNGIDLDRFAGAAPEARDRPYLLCIGRLEAYKGVQHAVRALPELPGYDLLVAGEGPYRSELRRAAVEAGVDGRVEFLGYVDADRVPGLYAGADAHLALSTFEAYGLTVAESLAAGTPCIVRMAGALRDWAGRDDCVAVASVDAATVAGAVEAAVDREPSRDGLLGWDEVADRWERKYGALLTAESEGEV